MFLHIVLINSNKILFTDKSYVPSIHKLLFFGRAITPSKLKIRFHARFFLAFYEDFVGKMKANRELENLDWISLNEAKNKKISELNACVLKRERHYEIIEKLRTGITNYSKSKKN